MLNESIYKSIILYSGKLLLRTEIENGVSNGNCIIFTPSGPWTLTQLVFTRTAMLVVKILKLFHISLKTADALTLMTASL